MRRKFILLAILALLIFNCNTRNQFHETENNNPKYKPNTVFVGNEDLNSPGFKALREKYQLDTIFHGETDELKRILLLRNWIRVHISINGRAIRPKTPAINGVSTAERIIQIIQKAIHATLTKIDWKA